MFVAEDDPRKRHLHDRRRIVARLQEPRQPLLAQPLELRGRKRRPQRHVGHERQRVSELRDRRGEPDRRVIERAAGPQLRAEEFDRHRPVPAPPCVPAPSSSIAAVMLASPYLPAGSAALPGPDDQVHLHQRHFVLLDDPDREAVGQLLFLNRRQLQRRRRGRLRRRPAIGLLRQHHARPRHDRADAESDRGDRIQPNATHIRSLFIW